MKKRVALSWSGGKDSCMVLDTLVREGHEVCCLITTVPQETGRTFGHGEKTELMKAQAEALGIPLELMQCTYEGYTEQFVSLLSEYKEKYQLDAIAFGDLYLDGHREWGEKVAERVGLEAMYPHWMKPEESLEALRRFVESGYETVVIRVREDQLSEEWLGRKLDESFYQAIQQESVCPMGEGGEYHTFVYDGPLFQKRIQVTFGEILPLETTKRLEIASFQQINKKKG